MHVPKIASGEEHDAWETEVSEVSGAGVKGTRWGWQWGSKGKTRAELCRILTLPCELWKAISNFDIGKGY